MSRVFGARPPEVSTVAGHWWVPAAGPAAADRARGRSSAGRTLIVARPVCPPRTGAPSSLPELYTPPSPQPPTAASAARLHRRPPSPSGGLPDPTTTSPPPPPPPPSPPRPSAPPCYVYWRYTGFWCPGYIRYMYRVSARASCRGRPQHGDPADLSEKRRPSSVPPVSVSAITVGNCPKRGRRTARPAPLLISGVKV